MTGMNGVIQTNTGILKRKGPCDFRIDGSFDPDNESYVENIPFNSKTLGTEEFVSKKDGEQWVFEQDLSILRRRKDKEIDKTTRKKIKKGHLFDNRLYSLSASNQTYVTNLKVGHMDSILQPPVDVTTKDDQKVTLNTSQEIKDFYENAFGSVKIQLDSGRDLKQLVAEALTKEDIQAIVDPRN